MYCCSLVIVAFLLFDRIDAFKLHHRIRRVVGGYDVNIERVPYQLSLRIEERHQCGAILISENWALSAAHCTSASPDVEKLTLLAGTTDRRGLGQIRSVSKFVNHPRYVRKYYYDISIMRVTEPFVLSPLVAPIGLPSQNEAIDDGTEAITSGWGRIARVPGLTPKMLRQTTLEVRSRKQCNSVYFDKITDNLICAGRDTGICDGDSGGPLVVDDKVVGIAVWSIGCAQPEFPSVFTRVASFREWIRSETGV